MSTALLLAPTSGKTDAGDDLDHYYCCDINRSLCGLDISELGITDFDDDGDQVCVVCVDLQDVACTNPGCPGPDTG